MLALRAQFGATPYPPTGATPGAVALAKLVGRLEWVAEGATRVGEESASLALASVRAVSGAVADDPGPQRPAHLRRLGPPGRRPRAGPGGRGIGARARRVDLARARQRGDGPHRPGHRPGARAPRAPGGRRRPRTSLVARPELPRPRPRRRHRAGGRRRLGVGRRPAERWAVGRHRARAPPAPGAGGLAPVGALGLVPQRAARRHRTGPGGRRGRADQRRARVLGRPGHAVGAPLERAGHRRHRPAGHRWHRRRLRGRLGAHARHRRPLGAALGAAAVGRGGGRGRPRR